MARVALTKTARTAISSDGTNITDMTGTNMTLGANNGVKFAYNPEDEIVLINDTGGAAVYSIIAAPATNITSLGGSITDPTVSVATGKTHVIKPTPGMKQSDGMVYIDCDVAANIAVLTQGQT